MTDNKDKIKLAPNKLRFTRVEESAIQHKFSKNRSKTVVVEVKKTRTFSRKDGILTEDARAKALADNESITEENVADNNQLTSEEQEKRLRVLQAAQEQQAVEEALAQEKLEAEEEEQKE